MIQQNGHIDPQAPHVVTVHRLPEHPTPDTAPRVSVVIPTYNEAKNLPYVFSRLPADLHEVIVVDGQSIDDTIEVARRLRPDVRIVLQTRFGKGNAVACGFAEATGDIVVVLDADGSADPQEIPLLVAALTDGADFVKGTTSAGGGGSTDTPRARTPGSPWLNRTANLLYGTRYTDLSYGISAFWSRCLAALELDPRPRRGVGRAWGDGFEIETLITTRMAKAGLRITEVPTPGHPRSYGSGDAPTWRDSCRVLCALLVERLNRKGSPPHPRRTRPAA